MPLAYMYPNLFLVVFDLESGEITSIVGNQAVAKPSGKLPEIGTKVFVKDGILGRVMDIIGAVENPFFVVKTDGKKKIAVGDKLTSD